MFQQFSSSLSLKQTNKQTKNPKTTPLLVLISTGINAGINLYCEKVLFGISSIAT